MATRSIVRSHFECPILKIYICPEGGCCGIGGDLQLALKNLYLEAIAKHNEKIMGDCFPDAGFDLFIPRNTKVRVNSTGQLVDLGIKTAMFSAKTRIPVSYYIYPRSSMSKTPLRLANSVGIIDSGYRGNLMMACDCIATDTQNEDTAYGCYAAMDVDVPKAAKHQYYICRRGVRLVQICSPTLSPLKVEMVDSVEELGISERGSGGFGSTGL